MKEGNKQGAVNFTTRTILSIGFSEKNKQHNLKKSVSGFFRSNSIRRSELQDYLGQTLYSLTSTQNYAQPNMGWRE